MPTYCTKQVSQIDDHSIEYILVSQKSSSEEFDPIIKKLYISKTVVDGSITQIYFKGYNFEFSEFKRTKLLIPDCKITINDNIQEATVPIDDVPKDIHEWHGDIAFLVLVVLRTPKMDEKYISKINEDIGQNDVRRKDHISRRAHERYSLISS
jgi:hypothetical protein